MKNVLKMIVSGVFLVLAWPLAAISLFGRISPIYLSGAHMVALGPGLLGDYLRGAYYRLTLESCSLQSRISFGVIFAHPQASVGPHVYIGPYCVLGRTRIGAHTQIASLAQILSGAKQHERGEDGSLSTAKLEQFEVVTIGAHCWIGAAAIVMAPVGAETTIGAGAVVTREIPARVIAVGNPARVLRSIDL